MGSIAVISQKLECSPCAVDYSIPTGSPSVTAGAYFVIQINCCICDITKVFPYNHWGSTALFLFR